MTMTSKKLSVINEVITAYQDYCGNNQSKLEVALQTLIDSGKLCYDDYSTLLDTLDTERKYICTILANSHRIWVKFNSSPITPQVVIDDFNFDDDLI